MKYSRHYRWFYNVLHKETDKLISCLVALDQYYCLSDSVLVEEGGQHAAYRFDRVNELNKLGRCNILGKILRVDCPLEGSQGCSG